MAKSKVIGEIGVSAATAPPRERIVRPFTIELEVEEIGVLDAIECGFQQGWITGEGDGREIELTAGAGVGSRWALVRVKERDGTERRVRIDSEKLLMLVLDGLLEEEG